jgi:hypothetical protein
MNISSLWLRQTQQSNQMTLVLDQLNMFWAVSIISHVYGYHMVTIVDPAVA